MAVGAAVGVGAAAGAVVAAVAAAAAVAAVVVSSGITVAARADVASSNAHREQKQREMLKHWYRMCRICSLYIRDVLQGPVRDM